MVPAPPPLHARSAGPDSAGSLSPAAMVAIALLLGILGLFGEKVQAGGGLGWDGRIYAGMAAGFPAIMWNGAVAPYYAHRIVAPALAAGLIRLAGAESTPAAVILGFGIVDLLAQIGIAFIWNRIGDRCRIGMQGRWIGFAALLLNFQAAKFVHFYPVLVDSTALCASLLLILAYLHRSDRGLFAATVFAGLCWNTGAFVGALLIAFSRGAVEEWPHRPIGRGLATAAAAALPLGVALLLAARLEAQCGYLCTRLQWAATRLPSLALAAAAALLLLWPARPPRFGRRVLLALAAFAIPTAIAAAISNPDLRGGTGPLTLAHFVLLSTEPGKFYLPFVSAAVFWGPLVLLVMLFWGDVAREARRFGWGMTANIAAALPLALVIEPRFLTFAWPFFVLCTVRALEGRLTRAFTWSFVLLAFVTSKLWLPINVMRWTGPETAGFKEFPKQLYYMNFGFWMAWPSFIAQAICCALLLLAFARWRAATMQGAIAAR